VEGHTYHIFDQPHLPAANAFYYLPLWIQYYEKFFKNGPLDPEDYIFPTISAIGTLQPHLPMTTDNVQKLINMFAANSGVSKLIVGCLTTHCFRRGGAQHRFMDAKPEDRWRLVVIRWWGAWSPGEKVRNDLINS
jgi:integrase